jgi:hypothetical protein
MHIRINYTKSPASNLGNVSEPRLMSQVGKSARNRVRVGQRVSVVREVDVPGLVC